MRGVAGKVVAASRYPMSDVPAPSARVFLNTQADFERVKRDGVRVTTWLFNMMFCASCRGETRVGIVVGRRFGNAVARNRGKRRFRALVSTTREWLLPGHDLVIFPKRPVLTVSHAALHTTWLTTLTSRGLMVPPDPAHAARAAHAARVRPGLTGHQGHACAH